MKLRPVRFSTLIALCLAITMTLAANPAVGGQPANFVPPVFVEAITSEGFQTGDEVTLVANTAAFVFDTDDHQNQVEVIGPEDNLKVPATIIPDQDDKKLTFLVPPGIPNDGANRLIFVTNTKKQEAGTIMPMRQGQVDLIKRVIDVSKIKLGPSIKTISGNEVTLGNISAPGSGVTARNTGTYISFTPNQAVTISGLDVALNAVTDQTGVTIYRELREQHPDGKWYLLFQVTTIVQNATAGPAKYYPDIQSESLNWSAVVGKAYLLGASWANVFLTHFIGDPTGAIPRQEGPLTYLGVVGALETTIAPVAGPIIAEVGDGETPMKIRFGNFPAITPTATASATATRTPTRTPSPTASPTRSPTPTASPTATMTKSPTPTASPTASPSPSASPTRTPTKTPTASPTATVVPPTKTPTKTPTASPTASPTRSPTPTASPTRTATPTVTPTATTVPPTQTPTRTPTPTPSRTATPTATASPTRSPTPTASPTPSPTPTPNVCPLLDPCIGAPVANAMILGQPTAYEPCQVDYNDDGVVDVADLDQAMELCGNGSNCDLVDRASFNGNSVVGSGFDHEGVIYLPPGGSVLFGVSWKNLLPPSIFDIPSTTWSSVQQNTQEFYYLKVVSFPPEEFDFAPAVEVPVWLQNHSGLWIKEIEPQGSYIFPGYHHDFSLGMKSKGAHGDPDDPIVHTVHFVLIHNLSSPDCDPVINPVAVPAEVGQTLGWSERPIGYSSMRVTRSHPPNAAEHWTGYE